jgi:hypothetical protein
MDWHDRVEVRAELRKTYTDQWVSYILRPQGFTADPGAGDRWSDQWEYLRNLFVDSCKQAIEVGMGASDIAKDAGAEDVREIVMALNDARMKLPYPDDWPRFDDSQEATECRVGLRHAWINLATSAMRLPYEEDDSAEAQATRETHQIHLDIFRNRLREAVRLGVAVEPICTAARCTYDELLPHLLAIGYTQTYEKVNYERVTTISLVEPPVMCPQCLTMTEHCSCS